MEFKIELFYESSIDFARHYERSEVLELLLNGPIQSNKKLVDTKKKLNQEIILEIGKRISLMKKNCQNEKQMHDIEYLKILSSTIKNILNHIE